MQSASWLGQSPPAGKLLRLGCIRVILITLLEGQLKTVQLGAMLDSLRGEPCKRHSDRRAEGLFHLGQDNQERGQAIGQAWLSDYNFALLLNLLSQEVPLLPQLDELCRVGRAQFLAREGFDAERVEFDHLAKVLNYDLTRGVVWVARNSPKEVAGEIMLKRLYKMGLVSRSSQERSC
jgi:hypothetical protein